MDILADAAKELPDVQFVVAGNGMIDIEGDNILRVGFVTGRLLQTLIKNAEFVISPSVCTETFGLSYGEAIKLGTPVIATNLGAFPETVVDGFNGKLVELGDAENLGKAIEELWDDKKQIHELKTGCNKTELLSVEEYSRKAIKTYL